MRILGEQPHKRRVERTPGNAVKNITFDLGSILAGDGDVASIIKRLLQGGANFVFGGKFWNPAFDGLASRTRGHFQFLGIELARILGSGKRSICSALAFCVTWSAHARVSSIWALSALLICTSGLNACTGLAGSFKSDRASGSS